MSYKGTHQVGNHSGDIVDGLVTSTGWNGAD